MRKFTKYPQGYVKADSEITLTDEEKAKLSDNLYDILWELSEYHDDLEPSQFNTLQERMDAYFYWGDEYNDGYLGWDENDVEDKIDAYLLQEFNKYRGGGIPIHPAMG